VNPRAPQYLAGRLLLAMPGMMDQRFDRAVIAMCIHDDQGAFGIGIGEERAGSRSTACSKMSASIRV
jgi:putative transcriptional regulator